MKLPSKLNSYDKSTLLIVSAHDIARPFVINDRDVAELDVIHTEDTEFSYSDKEGFSYSGSKNSPGEGTVPGNAEKNDMHYDKVFANYLTKSMLAINKKYSPQVVIVTVPEDLKALVKKKLPDQIVNKMELIPANYINMPLPDILETIEKQSIQKG